MFELFKTYIKSALTIYQTTKNLDLCFTTAIKAAVDQLQTLQCKLFQITEFDLTNSTGWAFDFTTETMTNTSGTTKNLIANSILPTYSNIRIKKIILEGTSLSTATVSYTTGTNLATATWTTISSTENDDLDIIISSTTGIRFRIVNGDSSVTKMFVLYEIV